jgi:pantoate--beta-alanine ligase
MKLIKDLNAIQGFARTTKSSGARIGLVPTMGYLHEGHISLVKKIRPECDSLWVSIYINSAQFGPGEDIETYPRDLQRDLDLCQSAGVDCVITPQNLEIYPQDYSTWVTPGENANMYCGESRPGHFKGVLSIVLRLFIWTLCDTAIFGRKDAQQLWLIKRMAKDFNLPLRVLSGGIVREADGLAMSSRNAYLNPIEREAATVLNKSLNRAALLIENGAKPADALQQACELISKEQLIELEYLHAVNWQDLKSIASAKIASPASQHPIAGADNITSPQEVLLMLAAKLGKTRLIDNQLINLS